MINRNYDTDVMDTEEIEITRQILKQEAWEFCREQEWQQWITTPQGMIDALRRPQ